MNLDRLFDWPSRHHVHLALPIMLVLSAGLHVAGVFVFQLAHPRAQARSEHSARVYFLAPGSTEAARMAPLLAAGDPALFSPAHASGRDVWRIPETMYTASFDQGAPALLAAPAGRASAALPPVSDPGPVTRDLPFRRPDPVRRSGLPTAVTFSRELEGRPFTPAAGVTFGVLAADGLKSAAPAEFLVGVSPEGRPLYFFPRKSSGSELLDRAALRYLAGGRFAPREGPEATWGVATFHWGADTLTPAAP